MAGLRQDFRFGARILKRYPAFSLVAILVLTLGIGGISAIFTLVNTLTLKPRVLSEPDRLLGVYSKSLTRPDAYRAFSYPNYLDLKAKAGEAGLSSLMAHNLAMVGLSEGETVRRTFADIVSANYFETLGVALERGRVFSLAEEQPGSAIPVAIVGYAYWQKSGADPKVLGSTLRINSRPFTVIGIAPRGFQGRSALLGPEVWLPLGMHEAVTNDFDGPKQPLAARDHHVLMLIGRLANAIERDVAEARLAAVATNLRVAYPAEMEDQTIALAPLSRVSISTSPSSDAPLATVSILLLAMAGIVLTISCLNLANMLLARGTARRREFAVRLAVGGGRGQIVRQLLVEGLILSLIGGIAGALLAYGGNRLLVSSLTAMMPFPLSLSVAPDVRTVAALFGFCLLSTLLFGLGPALQLARAGVVAGLKDATGVSRGSGRLRGALAPRNLLVVGQLALSMVLLAAAGLFVRGARAAAHPELGYPIERSILVEVDASLAGFDESSARSVYARALERLRALPGVSSASYSATVPFGMVSLGDRVGAAGKLDRGVDPTESNARGAGTNVIGADYFESLGLALRSGRAFTVSEEESAEAPPVAIIDQTLAEAIWPGESALGHQIEVVDQPNRVYEVVGVVPAVQNHLFERDGGQLYLPFGRHFQSSLHFHLRTTALEPSEEQALLATIRRELRALDERLPVLGVTTLEGQLEQSIELWTIRIAGKLFAIFGTLALFIAAVGAYGLRAYAVGQRTREIGLRMALGATPRDTLDLILREGLSLTLVGLGIGLVLAFGVARLLSGVLYEVSAADPVVFSVTPLVLIAAITLACWVPARRAARVEPMVALRDE